MIPTDKNKEDFKNSCEILYLPCNKLMSHPLRFEFYKQSHLDGLVSSIKEAGLLEPIVVCPKKDDNYIILSGHYRLHAVRRLKWKKVICRVIKCDERLSSVIYCTSNILTRGLSSIEEAHMISLLVSQEKFTFTEIGKMWGRSKSWVSRRIGLLTHLDPKIKKDIRMGYLSPRMAQELMRLPQGNDQERVLKIIRKRHMNKDDASKLVTWWLGANESERMNVEKGIVDERTNVDVFNNYLTQTVAKHLERCTSILNKLIFIIQNQKVIEWWPVDSYIVFKNASEHLENLLTEQSALHKGG